MPTERELLDKMNLPARTMSLPDLFRHLLSFWQHTSLYKRTCDYTGKEIISVFDEYCPYPIWHHDEWIKHANPPSAEYNFQQSFFEQVWNLFQRCPLPHNTGVGNENCEYTDDGWNSKKCYLSHSFLRCEDVYYSYRVLDCRNCFFCVFSNNCELSTDVTNCTNCYNVTYALDAAQCRDSAFLFDCRNCSDCLFCFNLRNKQFCIENQQYTEEEYRKVKAQYSFSSRRTYEEAKKHFKELIQKKAWWRAQHLEHTENVTGDYLRGAKDSSMAFFIDDCEDAVNCLRAVKVKDIVNSVGCFGAELVAYTVFLGSEGLYDIRYSVNLNDCTFMEYCFFCANCDHCFACAGLVGKKYCILNKEYSKEEYEKYVAEIKAAMKKEGSYGQLFPAYFAPCSYEQSLATVYFPLSAEEQSRLGFRVNPAVASPAHSYTSVTELPEDAQALPDSITQRAFWDEIAKRPFTLQAFDIEHSQKQHVPLPNCFYARRINENLAQMYFNGAMRETTCAHTGQALLTTLPKELDGRILSEVAYQGLLH